MDNNQPSPSLRAAPGPGDTEAGMQGPSHAGTSTHRLQQVPNRPRHPTCFLTRSGTYNKRNVLCQRTNKAGMKAPLTTAARGSHSPKTVTGNRSRPRAPWEHTAVGHACLAGFMICHYSTRTARNRELILIVPSPSPQKYPGGSRSLREERVLWKNTNPQKQGP